MKNQKKIVLSLSLIFATILFAFIVLKLQAQDRDQQQDESPLVKKIRQSHDPIAEYDSPEPYDPKERYLRRLRNSKLGLDKYNLKPEQKEAARLKENSPEIFISYILGGRPLPAFPIFQNTLVVIGKITDAKAFLTNDKTYIYSEFTLNVEDVLRQPLGSNLSRGDSTVLIRGGGKVKLPSGKILYRGTSGYLMPEVSKRYLLFLEADKEIESFGIITGYEFQGGQVIPLDGEVGGNIAGKFIELYKYKGVDENTLINLVKARIAQMNIGGR